MLKDFHYDTGIQQVFDVQLSVFKATLCGANAQKKVVET